MAHLATMKDVKALSGKRTCRRRRDESSGVEGFPIEFDRPQGTCGKS